MLSRIGNSLFWMGRYIERAEQIARFARAHYMSSVDAPLNQNMALVLESILSMAGNKEGYFNVRQQLDEEEVLYYTTISDANPFSILAYVNMIRENARGARDSISIELWEAINRFYHKINEYNASRLYTEGIEAFSVMVEESSNIIKGYIENTLLRNEEWMLISLGIQLEKAMQVNQILQTKLSDIEKLRAANQGEVEVLENYLWTTTLESTEAFDMYKRIYKTSPCRRNVLDFLLFNRAFPKSIAFSLAFVKHCIEDISFQEEEEVVKQESIDFMAGKLLSQFQYSTVEEIEDIVLQFLQQTLASMYNLASLTERKYLKYK